MKLSDVPINRLFVTALGNVCQKTGPTTITRLFNQAGEPCNHLFTGRSPDESISTILPPGTNF
jgi:hypothetical protein